MAQKKSKLKKRKVTKRPKRKTSKTTEDIRSSDVTNAPQLLSEQEAAESGQTSQVKQQAKIPSQKEYNEVLAQYNAQSNASMIKYLEEEILPKARTMRFEGALPVLENGELTTKRMSQVSQVEELIAKLKAGTAQVPMAELPIAQTLTKRSEMTTQEYLEKEQAQTDKDNKSSLWKKVTKLFK